MNDRELIHSALLWHAAHERRMAVGKQKRQLDAKIKAEGIDTLFSSARAQQGEVARQLTELKRRELAATRKLAGACAAQRERFDVADVIDGDGSIRLLRCDE